MDARAEPFAATRVATSPLIILDLGFERRLISNDQDIRSAPGRHHDTDAVQLARGHKPTCQRLHRELSGESLRAFE